MLLLSKKLLSKQQKQKNLTVIKIILCLKIFLIIFKNAIVTILKNNKISFENGKVLNKHNYV